MSDEFFEAVLACIKANAKPDMAPGRLLLRVMALPEWRAASVYIRDDAELMCKAVEAAFAGSQGASHD